uniref:U28-Sparatoxin-Hju1d_1 n=1 Tax=Heteropoda jugulans TaxID=1358901 RepID=A0A4Q8K8P3_9ARAC
MKLTIVVMLLFVAFSAVTLAEKSIEDAALDLVEENARQGCGKEFGTCVSNAMCCTGFKCTPPFCLPVWSGRIEA